MDSTRTLDGRVFVASSACDAGWCIGVPADGRLDAVADTKTLEVLRAPAQQLVTFAKTWSAA